MSEPTNSKETKMDEIADKVDELLDDIETEVRRTFASDG